MLVDLVSTRTTHRPKCRPNGYQMDVYAMDLRLISEGQAFRLQPESVHGMLWLQTHFEKSHWELLAEGLATLSPVNVDELIEDASNAGLNLSPLPALSSQLNS